MTRAREKARVPPYTRGSVCLFLTQEKESYIIEQQRSRQLQLRLVVCRLRLCSVVRAITVAGNGHRRAPPDGTTGLPAEARAPLPLPFNPPPVHVQRRRRSGRRRELEQRGG